MPQTTLLHYTLHKNDLIEQSHVLHISKALFKMNFCHTYTGNMVVDGVMDELFGQPYDDGGAHVSLLWCSVDSHLRMYLFLFAIIQYTRFMQANI